jgi:hypothetical protein
MLGHKLKPLGRDRKQQLSIATLGNIEQRLEDLGISLLNGRVERLAVRAAPCLLKFIARVQVKAPPSCPQTAKHTQRQSAGGKRN